MKKKYIIPQFESNTIFQMELLMLRDSGQYSNIMETKERDVEFEKSEEHELTYGSIW